MKLAVMQPYIFPYIGYFQLISAADKFVVLDDVTFIKQGWINRNRILLNNKPYLFTIPLEKQSSNTPINRTKISYASSWQPKLCKTFEQAYKKAPFYGEIMELFADTVSRQPDCVSEIALYGIKKVCEYLEIKTPFVDSSEKYENSSLRGEARIIDICLRENARTYINAIGGKTLYTQNNFMKYGIELRFIRTDVSSYEQFSQPFQPFLSIIDVLMFNDKNKVKEMLNQYRLEE